MDLIALADFNLVALHGGFGRASRATGQSKATLSRRVRDLETALGVRLIERGARSLRLTEEGAVLHARTAQAYGEIDALQDVKAGLGQPGGRLRVSAPMLFGQTLLGPLAAAFVAAYPGITLEVGTEDRFVDLVADEVDVVIRVNPRPDDSLVGRCFMQNRMVLVAPPQLPRPQAGSTFPAVARIGTPDQQAWRTTDPADGTERLYLPRPVLKFSSPLPMREAACAGVGAAIIPHDIVAADIAAGRLVSWGYSSEPAAEVWALHASRRLVSPKVQAFVDFVCEYFKDRLAEPKGL